MDIFDISVMLKDGSFADYTVENERGSSIYKVLKEGKELASFESQSDGEWKAIGNTEADEDLQQRLINQLNGLQR